MDNREDYDLRLILFTAREKKGYSQRKLAREIGIHHSSLNDIENGKIKKIDIEILRKIAEELDLSLEILMKAAGYNQVACMFEQSSSVNKSTSDLKKIIEEYQLSQMEMLDDSYKKRSNVKVCRTRLHSLITKLEDYDLYKDLWTMEKIIEELKDINKELNFSSKKYDCSKLPKDNI